MAFQPRKRRKSPSPDAQTPESPAQSIRFASRSGSLLPAKPQVERSRSIIFRLAAQIALLSHYLRTRSQLRGLILLMDARHPCTALDTQMIEWFIPTGNPIHILLTKADKLSRQQGLAAQRATQQRLDKYARSDTRSMLSVQLFSALKRSGLDTVYQVIERWLA